MARKSVGGRAPIALFQRQFTGRRMSVEPSPGVKKPKPRRRKCKTKFSHKKTHRARTIVASVDNTSFRGPVEEEEGVEKRERQAFDNGNGDLANRVLESEGSDDEGIVESAESERSTTETRIDYDRRWPGYSSVIPSFDDYIQDEEGEEEEN